MSKKATWVFAAATAFMPMQVRAQSDCDVILGDRTAEGAFTVLQNDPLTIVLNGGQLEDVTVTLPMALGDTTIFSKGGESALLTTEGQDPSFINTGLTLPFAKNADNTNLYCDLMDLDFGGRTMNLTCGATGIFIQSEELIVQIQEGETLMRTPTATTCSISMKLEM